MKRTYYMVEGVLSSFTTLKEIRLWLYNKDIQERFEFDTFNIYYCLYGRSFQGIPMRQIHVHPITGEVWFSKVV